MNLLNVFFVIYGYKSYRLLMSGMGERWGGLDWGDWEMENFFIG